MNLPTWPEDRMPTPEEWTKWFMEQENDADREQIAEKLLEQLYKAALLHVGVRDHVITELVGLQMQVGEYSGLAANIVGNRVDELREG